MARFSGFSGIPWNFKSLRLRDIRDVRGYAMGFKSGGCGDLRGFWGGSGEIKGRVYGLPRLRF